MAVGQVLAYPDFITPWYMIVAVIAALDYRQRTGKGQCIDMSQFETSVSFLSQAVLDYTVNERVTSAVGNRCDAAAPHGAYRCQGDDRWCVIAASDEEEWKTFCKVISDPEWTIESRFSTFLGRKKNEDELDRLIEQWSIEHAPEQVMQMMQAAGVPAGVVQTGRDIQSDPQVKYREYYHVMEHPEMGEIECPSSSFRLSKTPSTAKTRSAAPSLGEHTEYVCQNILKMSHEEFVELERDGNVFL